MEEVLHSPHSPEMEADTDQQTGSTWNLALGIAASVALHLICTVVLLSLPDGPPGPQSITFVDLDSIPAQAPMTPPAKKAPPAPVTAKEELPPLPENPTLPETPVAPEPPQQVEQAAQAQEQPPAAVEEQLSPTTLGLGLSRGFFKGLGNGETLRDDIKDYYLAMLQVINEKWWLDPQLQKRKSAVVVNIVVARNGDIVDSRILAGSGDRRYDRTVLAALTAASPLPPLPESYRGDFFEVPIRLVPPLDLMVW